MEKPRPPGFGPLGAAPWTAKWKKDGAGRPETGGTIHPGVVHQKPLDGPERTGWEREPKSHTQTSDSLTKTEEPGSNRQVEPSLQKSRSQSQDPPPEGWCRLELGQGQSRLHPETEACRTLPSQRVAGLRQKKA